MTLPHDNYDNLMISPPIHYLHFPHLQGCLLALQELVPHEGQVPQPGQHHDGAAEALVPDELPRPRDDLLDGGVAVWDLGAGEDGP